MSRRDAATIPQRPFAMPRRSHEKRFWPQASLQLCHPGHPLARSSGVPNYPLAMSQRLAEKIKKACTMYIVQCTLYEQTKAQVNCEPVRSTPNLHPTYTVLQRSTMPSFSSNLSSCRNCGSELKVRECKTAHTAHTALKDSAHGAGQNCSEACLDDEV